LPQGIVEALEVISFPCLLRNRLVPFRWDDPSIRVILIRMERRLFPADQRNVGPQRFGTLTTPVTHVQGNNLVGGRVHGDPGLLLVSLPLHETPHLIGFSFQPAQHDVRWARWNADMEVLRTGRKASHHKVQQPRETDTHGAADAAERDALTVGIQSWCAAHP
jgi:hypothetical protein